MSPDCRRYFVKDNGNVIVRFFTNMQPRMLRAIAPSGNDDQLSSLTRSETDLGVQKRAPYNEDCRLDITGILSSRIRNGSGQQHSLGPQ